MKRFSILVLVFGSCVLLPPQLSAQQKLPHYTVIDLGTLGGTFSETSGNNTLGGEWVTGDATLLNDTADRAFLWHLGRMTDLGTLGGPNSFGWGVNDRGNAVGAAESSATDPLDEDWCGYGDDLKCLPFLWRNDIRKMIALPTLGGNNGAASGINSRDEVAGQAENANIDQTCVGIAEYLQIEPALWRNGKVYQLALVAGDADGAAFAINDWGQAVGVTFLGSCANPNHAVLWQNGKAIDLGNFGGTMNNEAYGINNWGQVVGKSGLSGDNFHAFLWQRGVMTNLGTLSGDVNSAAFGINDTFQVVGDSWDASGNPRGFLWQNGVMTDLNTLIPSESPLYLVTANGINDRGQIAGTAWQSSTSEEHAYLATPSYGEAVGESATTAATEHPMVTLPENVRKLLQRRARFGGVKGGLVTPTVTSREDRQPR